MVVVSVWNGFFTPSEYQTVTAVASHTGEGDPPGGVTADIEKRLDERTDRQVGVRARFRAYQTA
ncbi:hypothetical protein [Halalkalicoccus ordinarius]|uniref:hypothetical protein n=1 Tax=Halalkalicoccus ordinarius TaxID=3116651 RepID=UPI00300F51BB